MTYDYVRLKNTSIEILNWTNLISRVYLENVRPPPGLFTTRPFDEGYTFRWGHGKAVRMPSDVFGCGYL